MPERIPNPKREWLVWLTADNAFRQNTGRTTTIPAEATAYSYASARTQVVAAALKVWPGGQPPMVMVRTLDPGIPPSVAAQLYTKAIDEASAAMVADREIADWTHPVPVGGLPEEPDFVPASLVELVGAARNRHFKAEFALRDADISRDVDPAVAEFYRAEGALDAVEDQWQAQMRSDR